MRSIASLAAIAVAATGLVVPDAAAVTPAGPQVVVSSPWVESARITGSAQAVELRTDVEGTGPFTWSGRATIFAGDHGRVVDLAPADGAPQLVTGTQSVTIGTTQVFDSPGAHDVWFTVTDGAGAQTTVATTVNVVSKVRTPRIGGVAEPRSSRKKVIWGAGDPKAPADLRYRVFLKPRGARHFSAVGLAESGFGGRWWLRSPRLRPGTYVVKSVSSYLLPARSKKVALRERAFSEEVPTWLRRSGG